MHLLKKHNGLLNVAVFAADAALITAAFFIAYIVRQNWEVLYSVSLRLPGPVLAGNIASLREHVWLLLLIVPLWEAVLLWQKALVPSRTAGFIDIAWTVAASVFIAAGLFGAIAFALHLTFMSRGFIMVFVVFSAVSLVLGKWALMLSFRALRRSRRNLRHVLVVGTGKRAEAFIAELVAHPEWGMHITGVVDKERERVGKDFAGCQVIGRLQDIPRILVDKVVDVVAFVVPRTWLGDISESIRHCELQGVDVQVALDLFEYDIGRVRMTNQGQFPVLCLESTDIPPWQARVKRTIDVVGSAALLLILSPVLLAIAAVVKVSSPGPALYGQTRHGLRGREFRMLKIRTMVQNADELLADLKDDNQMSGAAFKIANDPRVTKIGRFLRRFSLDELPQLINVLKGDMSLVGPRPLIASEKDKYEEWQRRRMSVRPGLTCLWQINGRNEVDFEHWMKLDLQYIDNLSIFQDFKILAKTLPAMLHGRGAY